jgi:formate hydrogenlyase transcriptional activator
VPELLEHFGALFANRYQQKPMRVRQGVRGVLMAYPWPGNIRELAAWVERAYATGLEPELLAEMLLAENSESSTTASRDSADEMSLDQVERQAIARAMDHCDFNQRKAARLLNIHRATLARKLKKHDLA